MGFGWYKLIGGIREAKYVSRKTDGHPISIYRWSLRSSRLSPDHRSNSSIELKPELLATRNRHADWNSELAREKMWARINLIPLLQAEEDRDQVRRYWADQKREKELLGENTKVYNNERCVKGDENSGRNC
ncbi:hypothetical protein VCV18_004455 [Metarhizium anisopliae]